MPLEVDYVPFATGGGANVYTAATYQALAVVGTGVEPGLADPQLANTTWRLASMVSAAIGNFISNVLGVNVLDDGNVPALTSLFASAVSTGSATKPTRTVSSSANLNVLITDYRIAFARVSGVAALVATLPLSAAVGQSFKIGDIQGNANAAPISVAPPAGHNLANLPGNYVINVNRAFVEFTYCGSNTWSIEQ